LNKLDTFKDFVRLQVEMSESMNLSTMSVFRHLGCSLPACGGQDYLSHELVLGVQPALAGAVGARLDNGCVSLLAFNKDLQMNLCTYPIADNLELLGVADALGRYRLKKHSVVDLVGRFR
jgi:hypothetical protein